MMSDKEKKSVVVFGIIAVIFLIVFMVPSNNRSLFKSASLVSEPFFPTQKTPQKEAMQALLSGKLKLEGRCLKIDENLIVWPYGFSLDIQGDVMKVLDEKGNLVAQVGDTIKLGGGQVATSGSPSGNLSKFMNEDCKGPLWITGEVVSQKK